uniref:Uncharacterized protein n=1 Tax=Anguilla anguilla TaxID=7936 RepID=A0A0E9WBJ5_ANGAN
MDFTEGQRDCSLPHGLNIQTLQFTGPLEHGKT